MMYVFNTETQMMWHYVAYRRQSLFIQQNLASRELGSLRHNASAAAFDIASSLPKPYRASFPHIHINEQQHMKARACPRY
jgi:hypothetical protein